MERAMRYFIHLLVVSSGRVLHTRELPSLVTAHVISVIIFELLIWVLHHL
jgi:hypothetical protein